ncbi:hypothetical protein IJ425_01005 [bacterium]|nr:hypothetical protein [bacterium]
MITKIQNLPISKISFTSNPNQGGTYVNPDYMDAFKTRAFNGERTPARDEYHPRVTKRMKMQDSIGSVVDNRQAKTYRSRMEKTLPLHDIANDFKVRKKYLTENKDGIVREFKSYRENFFLKELALASCNTPDNFFTPKETFSTWLPSEERYGAYDLTVYTKKNVPNYLSGSDYKVTSPSMRYEDTLLSRDGQRVVGSEKLFDFDRKIEAIGYSTINGGYKADCLHAFAPECVDETSDLRFIPMIGKPASLYGARIYNNGVKADFLVTHTLDSAGGVKVSRIYISPKLEYSLDSNNKEVLTIDAEYVYQAPSRRIYRNEEKFYRDVHETYHSPDSYIVKASNAMEFRSDGKMVDSYVGYEYDSVFDHVTGKKSTGCYQDAIEFKYNRNYV